MPLEPITLRIVADARLRSRLLRYASAHEVDMALAYHGAVPLLYTLLERLERDEERLVDSGWGVEGR